jgi:hypothetical protein
LIRSPYYKLAPTCREYGLLSFQLTNFLFSNCFRLTIGTVQSQWMTMAVTAARLLFPMAHVYPVTYLVNDLIEIQSMDRE